MQIKVYYGSPEGVWVYIDGRKTTTEQATNELLLQGKIKVSKHDTDKNSPVGLFSPAGNFYVEDSSKPQQGEIPLLYGERGYVAPIDYAAITPADLKHQLESRIDALKEHIKGTKIEIECIRGSPPD